MLLERTIFDRMLKVEFKKRISIQEVVKELERLVPNTAQESSPSTSPPPSELSNKRKSGQNVNKVLGKKVKR